MMDLVRALVRPVVTVSLVATLIALSLLGREVPEPLASLTVAVVSFWFGSRRPGT